VRPQANWKIRRRYVGASWAVGVVMIALGALAVWGDRMGAVDLITGGVALITLVVGSYIGGAVADDALQNRRNPDGEVE
jgi:uncharacterized membrane protein YkgB